MEEAQKQLGKEDKEKVSRSISESSGDVKKSRVLGKLVSEKASVSESINISTTKEFIFDEKLFTQKLDVFTGVCFLSDGAKILEPTVVHLQPYFGDVIKYGIRLQKQEGEKCEEKQGEMQGKKISVEEGRTKTDENRAGKEFA